MSQIAGPVYKFETKVIVKQILPLAQKGRK